MILIDANLLLYAHNSSGQEYEPAKTWLTTVMGGPDDVRLAWPTVLAFVRIGTAHAIFQRPLTLECPDERSGYCDRSHWRKAPRAFFRPSA